MRSVHDIPVKNPKVIEYPQRTHFVENKDQLLALALAPPYFFLHQSTPAALRVARIQYKDDNVALIDDFVQCTHVMLAHLFLGLAATG